MKDQANLLLITGSALLAHAMRATQEDVGGEERQRKELQLMMEMKVRMWICPPWYIFFQTVVALLRVISIGSYSQKR